MKYFFTPRRMARIKKTHNKVLARVWGISESSHCWAAWKMVLLLWKTTWQLTKMLHIELPYDPANPLLGKSKHVSTQNLVYWILIATLFIIAKRWEQPKCLFDWQMYKHIWHIIEMKYLATKSNKVIIHATTGMNLKDIMLTRNTIYYMIQFM